MTPTPPSRFRKRLRLAAGSVGAVVVGAALLATLVPDVGTESEPGARDPTRVMGAVHMHTRLSDGSGTVDDLVDAASAQDLDFIIVTDHNTAEPTRYEYRDGILVVIGEEVSTLQGHVMLLGVDSVRLGEPNEQDRLGGLHVHREIEGARLRIVSHPNGRRFWRDRTLATVDGMEIWNADSEWRNDGVADWLEALVLLPFRPSLGMLALVDRPDANLALLDSILPERPLAATCAVDAHARIPITRTLLIPFPTYRMTLGLVHQHLVLAEPLTGDARSDGLATLDAMAANSGYCAIGGLGPERDVRIDATDRKLNVDLPPGLEGARIQVYRNGEMIHEEVGRSVRLPIDEGGVFRVEIDLDVRLLRRRWMPWIISGPLRVDVAPAEP